ncbi:DUF397 domain-containing protein [Umezawaea beigongshangensis]|uniref:DUF397 domain-containing protein n=1 Tax=Umezawaea beigongshangensis TaxID=2780383 RepID=UPI0018F18688|nr:DUF397 domain-containing protein [Umezawaea beigongshangensis]
MLEDTRWRKSSYSGGEGTNCVELAWSNARLLVRDSKNTAGPTLNFPAIAWIRFLTPRPRREVSSNSA